MSAASTIEWTDATWNPVRGCSIVSKGCTNCYAMKQAHRFGGPGRAYEGLTMLTKGGPVWTGKITTHPELLDIPLRWRTPRRIFVNSMSDLFHEEVPFEFIDSVFAVMSATQHHTFQILTKRPSRMLEWFEFWDQKAKDRFARDFGSWPLKNVWLGVSVEDQAAADERIPLLLQTPAAVRWISAEPLLGPVKFRWDRWLPVSGYEQIERQGIKPLDWVVVGGESGPGARPMHPDWARDLRFQCAAFEIPFFFKQWGDWAPNCICQSSRLGHRSIARPEPGKPGVMFHCGKRLAGRLIDGLAHDEYPA